MPAKPADDEGRTGVATDPSGGPVVDPTANVLALSEASNKRQDDLREAERRYNDLRSEHQEKLANVRADHQKELNAKEASRLDSIRQVDREEVAKTAAQNNLAISTLAAQVQTTAQAVEARRQADMSEVNKRVSALELALSASAGKSTVSDPAYTELLKEVKALREKESTRTGFDAGKATVIAGVGLLGGGLGALVMKFMGH